MNEHLCAINDMENKTATLILPYFQHTLSYKNLSTEQCVVVNKFMIYVSELINNYIDEYNVYYKKNEHSESYSSVPKICTLDLFEYINSFYEHFLTKDDSIYAYTNEVLGLFSGDRDVEYFNRGFSYLLPKNIIRASLKRLWGSDPKLLSVAIKSNMSLFIKMEAIRSGLYTDASDVQLFLEDLFDEKCPVDIGTNSFYAMTTFLKIMNDFWSDKFQKYKTHSDARVRLFVFQKIGIIHCLDEMLADSDAKIRIAALSVIPAGHSSLSKMYGEIARDAFTIIARKVKASEIPYLLGNRNMKNPYIKKLIESRLSGEA